MVYDFDKMMILARENPVEFERQRGMLLDETIRSRSNIEQARAFQSRIDLERRRAKTPLASCLRLYSLAWDHVFKMNEHIQKLLRIQKRLYVIGPDGEKSGLQSDESKAPASAKILIFKKR